MQLSPFQLTEPSDGVVAQDGFEKNLEVTVAADVEPSLTYSSKGADLATILAPLSYHDVQKQQDILRIFSVEVTISWHHDCYMVGEALNPVHLTMIIRFYDCPHDHVAAARNGRNTQNTGPLLCRQVDRVV